MNKEILSHLKRHQDSQRQQRNTSKRSLLEDIVELTENGSNRPNNIPMTNKKWTKQIIQWDSTIRHVQHYNTDATPK